MGSIQCNPDTPNYTINHQLQDTLANVLTVTSRIATPNQKFCWQTESVWKRDSKKDISQALKFYVTFKTSATAKISTQSNQQSIELFYQQICEKFNLFRNPNLTLHPVTPFLALELDFQPRTIGSLRSWRFLQELAGAQPEKH